MWLDINFWDRQEDSFSGIQRNLWPLLPPALWYYGSM